MNFILLHSENGSEALINLDNVTDIQTTSGKEGNCKMYFNVSDHDCQIGITVKEDFKYIHDRLKAITESYIRDKTF